MPPKSKFSIKVPSLTRRASTPPSLSPPETPPSPAASSNKEAAGRRKSGRSLNCIGGSVDSDDEATTLEPVYIVLRPLNLLEAPDDYLKRLGRLVKAIEFENYLMLQHWGVLVGDKYYHLHIDDKTQKISVSMLPFIKDAEHERHTIKIPIWRTSLSHEERVGISVGIIKNMGQYSTESEVEITDETGNLITAPKDRERYTMKGRYLRIPIPSGILQRGKYNALTNNCIHFTRHYVFEQILLRKKEIKHLSDNIKWLVAKWGEMGCRRSPLELTKFLSGILGIGNPLAMTPEKGARLLIKLLSILLDIDYNSELDKKLLDNSASPKEALEGVSSAPVEEAAGTQTDPNVLPIPELVP